MPIAPSSAGKGVTGGVAWSAVHVPEWVAVVPEGTAEGIVKAARRGIGAAAKVLTTSVFLASDEIDILTAELDRLGTKLPGFIRKAWLGERLGQIASDDKRTASLPPNSTRIGMQVFAQPHAVGPIQADAAGGTAARFLKGLAGIIAEADETPLYGTSVAPVLANQARLPWATPVGLPDGYAPRMQNLRDDVGDSTDEANLVAVWDDVPPAVGEAEHRRPESHPS